MRYELVIALRYLRSGGLQTLLTITGVGIGVALFVFISALLNGLQDRIVEETIGNASQVTLTEPEREPRPLVVPDGRLTARQMLGTSERGIEGWRRLLPLVRAQAGVRKVSPAVIGGGFIRRGDQSRPVMIRGVPADAPSTIVDLQSALRQGRLELGEGRVAIGLTLADKLGLGIGQTFRLTSERDRVRQLRVVALFQLDVKTYDEGAVFMSLEDAQDLLNQAHRIDAIEVQVEDVFAAPRLARALARRTGLEATSWVEENQRLMTALQSQTSSGDIIKAFTLVAVGIGISGVLMVSVVRRRPEIGIMRSFGVSRRSVLAIFLCQGVAIAAAGAALGLVLGFIFSELVRVMGMQPGGAVALPVDPFQGDFAAAFLSAVIAGGLAGVLPARAAAQVDPARAIVGQ